MKHRRHMTVHPKTGDYYVRIMRDGVSRYFNLGGNERQARRRLEKIESDIASGIIAFATRETTATVHQDGSRDMRIEELAHRHLEWVKVNRSKGTFQNRRDSVSKFLRFAAPCMVSDITRIRLEEYHTWARENQGRGGNAGNAAMSHVKAMFRWAEEMDVCDLAYRRFPRIEHTPPGTPRLTDEEIEKLLDSATPDFRDLLRFGLLTGLRPPELRGLTMEHIVHDPGGTSYVLIQQHKTSRSSKEPKPRTVPLCPQAATIIRRQTEGHPDSDHIFLNSDGTPWKRHALRNALRRLCRQAGVKYVPPYALRHTFASMASEARAETTGLAMLMGHSTTRTLMRYVKNSFDHHLKTVVALGNRLDRIGGGGGGQDAKSMQVLSPATKSEEDNGINVNAACSASLSKPSR